MPLIELSDYIGNDGYKYGELVVKCSNCNETVLYFNTEDADSCRHYVRITELPFNEAFNLLRKMFIEEHSVCVDID